MLDGYSIINKYLQDYNSCLLIGFPCSLLIEAAIGLAPLLCLILMLRILFGSIVLFAELVKSEHGLNYFVWLLIHSHYFVFRAILGILCGSFNLFISLYFAPSQAFFVIFY